MNAVREGVLIISALLRQELVKRKKKKRCWVKKWIARRNDLGASNTLCLELQLEDDIQKYVSVGFAAFGINSSPYWILTAIVFLIFLTGVLNFGFLNTFSVDIFPTYVRAMAVCLTLMVGRGSAVLGINILKQLLDNNCEYVFYIFGSVTCFGGVVGFLLPSDAKILERKKLLHHDT